MSNWLKSGLLLASLAFPMNVHGQAVAPDSVAVRTASIGASRHDPLTHRPTGQIAKDRLIDQRIAGLLAHMTIEHKVAQLVEPDIGSITPEDMRRYRFGTILNGGNSKPGGNDRAPASAWLALADAMYRAGTESLPNGEPIIPPFWGTDAVHGDNNVIGATLFPHHVGLGAAHDPALVRRIGAATAQEIAATGIDWAFGPTLAVAKDMRWGRSYESFSENPDLVGQLGAAEIEGLQGKLGAPDFLDQHHVLATIKHFFADGGTGGIDQGDTRGDIDAIISTHAAPYRAAIKAGAQAVMASFSSINGEKMHGNRALLTDLLRDKMGFDGLLVGDWNAHGQVPGCSNTDCPKSFLAGLDVFMVPSDWRGLYDNLLRQARDGTIPQARLDEAVGRILRVKLRYGLFEKPAPAQRELAGQWGLLGARAHRDLAREAVAKSLVLLKNNGVLPIKPSARILVAGHAADSIAQASGGWTITWQGGGALTNADFPGGTSIYEGIAAAARSAGGSATLSPGGDLTVRPDVAVVVFGEQPYAEFVGDRPDFALHEEEGLMLLRKFKAAHIPTVAVLLSGRPLWVNRELALTDAFVAAWLPGSEGEGVADVLLGGDRAHPSKDFTGRLAFHWPAQCAKADPALFGLGYGGSYRHPTPRLRKLDQSCALLQASAPGVFDVFHKRLGNHVDAGIREGGHDAPLPGFLGSGPQGMLTVLGFDYSAQEDARELIWKGAAELRLAWPAEAMAAFSGGARGEVVVRYTLDQAPTGAVVLRGDCADCGEGVNLLPTLAVTAAHGWQTVHISLACLGGNRIRGLDLSSAAPLRMKIATISLRPAGQTGSCVGLV